MSIICEQFCDAWVIKEYEVKESWTKLFSFQLEGLRVSDSQGIAFDIFIRCFAFDYLRPFAYSKNGNMVLIYDGWCKLYWYNLKDLGFECIELPGWPEHFRDVTLCADSPVPLDAGIGMGVQRSEQQAKEDQNQAEEGLHWTAWQYLCKGEVHDGSIEGLVNIFLQYMYLFYSLEAKCRSSVFVACIV